jgi:hypothetical protein
LTTNDGSLEWTDGTTGSGSSINRYVDAYSTYGVKATGLSGIEYTLSLICPGGGGGVSCPETSSQLSLSPNPIWTERRVIATVIGCDNCDGKRVYVGQGYYEVLRCSCTVIGSGCSCIFTASTPSTSGTTFTYYSKIDKNGDGDYTDYGEKTSSSLTVYCKALSQPCSSTQPCCLGYSCSNGLCQQPQGGCPVLKVWDGNEYRDVVKLDIHSEKGKDTATSISFSMEPKDGKYYVKLSEIWYALMEGSHIDSVKLVDESGKECKLVSAIHDKNGDVLTAIAKSDDVRVETKPGEEIDLTFDGCKGEEFVFMIEGYNRWYLAKMALSQGNIIIIIVTLIIVIIIVYGAFKFSARKR